MHNVFLTDNLDHKTVNKQTQQMNALSKSLPTMTILVADLSDCYDYFARLSGFPNFKFY